MDFLNPPAALTMKITIAAFLLIAFAAKARAQSKWPAGTPSFCPTGCVYKNYPSREARKAKFPFNECASIVALSFLQPDDNSFGKIGDGRLNDTLGYNAVREIVLLSPQQQDSFSALLYNYYPEYLFIQSNCPIHPLWDTCDRPGHAFLFLNAAGRQIARLELCFRSGSYRASPRNFQTGYDCDSRMNLFHDFLHWLGITGGLER